MFRKPMNFQNHFQRGQATLEIVIVLLILIPLIFGGIEISHGVAVRAA
jgi:Flp pilus assembly protein TadG